ncbi:MAG: phage portal protein [Spirochaetes bacterium]|nr:phage portal protein [Spirochaetota bacterium]
MPSKPGLLARIIGRVLPEAIAVARENSPALQATATGYSSSSSRSGGAKWPGGLHNPSGGLTLDHWQIRQQARDAVHDSSLPRAIIERWADSVVGTGLVYEPTPDTDILGITPEEADAWSQKVAARFHLWAESKSSHRAGNMNWYQSQRLYELSQQRDNDMFVRYFYSQRPDLLSPVQWDFIDPNQIRGDAYTFTSFLGHFEDGITRDASGNEIAYKIWVQRPGKYEFDEVTVPRIGEKSGRIFMIHGFSPEYAGQQRGFSRIAHAIQEFQDITDFSAAQIKKAIAQSNLVLVSESDTDAPSGNPFDSIGMPPAGPASQQYGSTPTPAPGALNVAESVTYTPLEEATIAVPGSTMVFGLEGKNKLKPFLNTAPVTDYDTFVDSYAAYLAAANGIPIEMVLMRFNANYSASRGCLVLFWRNCIMWRKEMAADYLNPTKEMVLSGWVADGTISCPGFEDPWLRRAWLSCQWVGLPMPNIDPNATMKADQGYCEIGAQTLDDVARNLNGSSGRANRAKLAREFAELPKAPWAQQREPIDPMQNRSEDEKSGAPGKKGNGAGKPGRLEKVTAR